MRTNISYFIIQFFPIRKIRRIKKRNPKKDENLIVVVVFHSVFIFIFTFGTIMNLFVFFIFLKKKQAVNPILFFKIHGVAGGNEVKAYVFIIASFL